MSILTFVVSVVLLGALVALLTNGIMEGLKQIPAIDKLPAAVKFIIMLAIADGCVVFYLRYGNTLWISKLYYAWARDGNRRQNLHLRRRKDIRSHYRLHAFYLLAFDAQRHDGLFKARRENNL